MNDDRPVSPEETRRISLTFGVLYLITFVTSIPALWLFQPVLDNPAAYVAGAGHDNRIFLAAFLELLLIIANIGTAVVVFPLLKRVKRDPCARLPHGASRRVHVHPGWHPERARGGDAAAEPLGGR